MLLAITSSTETLGAALLTPAGDCLSEVTTETNRYSEALTTLMSQALAESGQTRAALTAIAVDIGPGSFTGTRASVTTAKTVAQLLGLPLIGVPATDALAAAALAAAAPATTAQAGTDPGTTTIIRAALDARRGSVYYADYPVPAGGITGSSGSSTPTGGAAHLVSLADFAALHTGSVRIVGTAAPDKEGPRACWVGRVALDRSDYPDDPLTLQPIYWRSADARTLQERGLAGPGIRA